VTYIHKVLSRGLYLRSQIEDKFPFPGHVSFCSLKGGRYSLVFGELTSAKGFKIGNVFTTQDMF
jgi:hypothetical protein